MASHRLAGVLFVFAAVVYLASGSVVPDSHDTTANAYVPVSLLGDGDLAFGALDPRVVMRDTIPAATLMVGGMELILASFLVSVLSWKGE